VTYTRGSLHLFQSVIVFFNNHLRVDLSPSLH
jgi:hypothetical protein